MGAMHMFSSKAPNARTGSVRGAEVCTALHTTFSGGKSVYEKRRTPASQRNQGRTYLAAFLVLLCQDRNVDHEGALCWAIRDVGACWLHKCTNPRLQHRSIILQRL